MQINFDPSTYISQLMVDHQNSKGGIKSLAKLDPLLTCGDFAAIIKDQNLFWLAYCKAVATSLTVISDFKVCLVGEPLKKHLHISGNVNTMNSLNYFIEQMRKLLLEDFEHRKNSEVLVIRNGHVFLLRKASPLIDLAEVSISTEGIVEFTYFDYIKPVLPQFAEYLGAIYTEDKKNQNVRADIFLPERMVEVPVIRMSWKEDTHPIYPINPLPIPKREKMEQALYTLYLEQTFFGDEFFINYQGGTIKVHTGILYLFGGQVIKDLFVLPFEMIKEKTIAFDYSKDTILAFIDFIYLGGQELLERMSSDRTKVSIAKLVELFEFANYFQIESLTDCSTNLISLFATPADLEKIEKLAKVFNNNHLLTLCVKLKANSKPREETNNFIKV